MAGAISTVVAHPFDTFKVRIQTNNMVNRYKGLYMGVIPPMLGAVFQNSILFYTYAYSLEQLTESSLVKTVNLDHTKVHDSTLYANSITAGMIAGFFTSFVTAPIELLKCRFQVLQSTNTSNNNISYSKIHSVGNTRSALYSPLISHKITLIKDIYRYNGFKGFFSGFYLTLLRDIPANGAYYGSYSFLLTTFKHIRPTDKECEFHREVAEYITAGSCAGALSWLLFYPIDVLKSRVQASPPQFNQNEYTIMKKAAIALYKGPWRSVTAGLGTCVSRGAVCNAVAFPVYELILKYV